MTRSIATYDRTGRFLSLSASAEAYGAPPPSKFIGTKPWHWVPASDREAEKRDWCSILKPGVNEHYMGTFWRAGPQYLTQFFVAHLTWVGLKEVAVVGVIEAFPGVLEHLSPRELDVLYRYGKGEHAKKIAQKLGITVSTVHVHSKTIRDKLQLGHNEKLVQFATLLRKSRGFQSLMEWDETKPDDDSHDTDLNLVIGGGRK